MTGTGAFVGLTLLVLAVPGPSVMYVVTRSIAQGRRAGLWSMLGLEAGLLVHVTASAAGLSSALAASDVAYTVIRCAGAGYLIYLAVREIRDRPGADSPMSGVETQATPLVWVRDGFLVDVLNPKTALFFLAFLPQFVDPAAGAPGGQLLVLGVAVVPLAALCDGSYALLAATARSLVLGSRRIRRRLGFVSGGAYLLLAGGALLG